MYDETFYRDMSAKWEVEKLKKKKKDKPKRHFEFLRVSLSNDRESYEKCWNFYWKNIKIKELQRPVKNV